MKSLTEVHPYPWSLGGGNIKLTMAYGEEVSCLVVFDAKNGVVAFLPDEPKGAARLAGEHLVACGAQLFEELQDGR